MWFNTIPLLVCKSELQKYCFRYHYILLIIFSETKYSSSIYYKIENRPWFVKFQCFLWDSECISFRLYWWNQVSSCKWVGEKWHIIATKRQLNALIRCTCLENKAAALLWKLLYNFNSNWYEFLYCDHLPRVCISSDSNWSLYSIYHWNIFSIRNRLIFEFCQ